MEAKRKVRIKPSEKDLGTLRLPAMDVQSGEWLGKEKSAVPTEKDTKGSQDLGDMLTQADLRGRSFVMSANSLFKIWSKGTGDQEATRMRIVETKQAPAIKGKEDKLYRFKFDKEGGLDDMIDTDTGKSVLPSGVVGSEEGGDFAAGGSVVPPTPTSTPASSVTTPPVPPAQQTIPQAAAPATPAAPPPMQSMAAAPETPAVPPQAAAPVQTSPVSPEESKRRSEGNSALKGYTGSMGEPEDRLSVKNKSKGGFVMGGNFGKGSSGDSPKEPVPVSQSEEKSKDNKPVHGKFGKASKMRVSKKSVGKGKRKNEFFYGGPVEGTEESGKYPNGDPDADKPWKENLGVAQSQVMGDKSKDFPADPKADDPAGFARGGEVNMRKMSNAQIQKEFGVKQDGGPETVFDVEVRDGKFVSAKPDESETKRFSRVVSENAPKNTALGDKAELEQASGSYNPKPNVGFASGAGFAEGGDVAEAAPIGASDVASSPEAAPGVSAPELKGDMKGPFASYAKVAGVDQALVTQGDTLFTQLDNAVSGENVEEAQAYLDQLRQYVKDVENARSDAVSKANDSSLAAAYKEMANDARDLLSAFENMVADIGSPEMKASRPVATSVS